MKKVVFLVLVFLAVMIGGALFWLNSPAVKDPALVSEMVKKAQDHFDEQQKTARDPAQNGYIDPKLLPVWKPQADPNDPLRLKLDGWLKAASSLSESKMLSNQTLRSPAVLALHKELKPTLDEIRRSFEKPEFAMPLDTISVNNPDFNLYGLRVCAYAISAEAEVDASGKNYQTLVATVNDLLTLAKHLESFDLLVNHATAITMRRIATGTILVSTTPKSALTGAEWSQLAQATEKGAPEGKILKSVLEAEFGETCLSLDHLISSEGSQNGDAGYIARKLLKREGRIYKNRMIDVIKSSDPMAELHKLNSMDGSEGAYFSGTYGKMTSSFIPDFEVVDTLFEYYRRREIALAFRLGIAAYQSQLKKAPTSLKDLAKVGLHPEKLEGDWLTYKDGTLTADVSLISEAEYKEIYAQFPSLGDAWFEYKAGKLVFKR